jgi:hypothetical protein
LVTDCKNVFVAPAISKREIERVLKEYAQLENVSLTEDTMDGTFVKLMVAALSGSEQARLDFFDIGKRPEVDGAVAEFYDIVSRIFIAASTKSDGGCSKAVNILK